MTREDWQAMILDHEKRLKALEARKPTGKAKSAPEATDAAQTKLADLWIELLGGKPPGYLFKALMPVIREHGWEKTAPVLRYVVRRTEIKFLPSAVSAIPATFGALEGQLRAFNGKAGTTTDAPEYQKAEYENAVDWVQENGGPVVVAQKVREKAKKDGIMWGQALSAPEFPKLVFLVLQKAGERP